MSADLLKSDACYSCDHVAREVETGAGYCRRSPSGDFDCEIVAADTQLLDLATEMVELLKRVADLDERRTLAESLGEAVGDVLFDRGHGVELDLTAFVALADLPPEIKT